MRRIRFTSDDDRVDPVQLDASQRAVLELPADASAAVIGAPGSGKTTTLVELLAHRVGEGTAADAVLALAPSRLTATRLRDAVALRLAVATDGPRVRTVPSLAFELATAAARRAGARPPRLITGGEQDADLAELLDDPTLCGPGGTVPWPADLAPRVRALRGFRSELREVLARITELGLAPADLSALGERTARPEWIAAATFLREYLDVVAESRPDQYDPAELARFAIRAIEDGTAGERVDRLRLVLVDDLQEATESTIAVLRAVAGRGIPVVAFGEPDIAANAFRGGRPDALGRLGVELGVPVTTVLLDRVHRHGSAIRGLVSAATGRVGAAAAGQQRATPAADPDGPERIGPERTGPERTGPERTGPERIGPERTGPERTDSVERITALSPGREAASIARRLREAHLLRGVPWNRMLVVVRSGGRVPGLARALSLHDVPTRSGSGGVALRDDPAARALLTVLETGVGRRELDPSLAEELLTGPFGGLDPLELRHLRRALRAEEVAGEGTRAAGELLVEALSAPGRLATIDRRWSRAAERLAGTLEAVRTRRGDAPGGTDRDGGEALELLWMIWDRSRLAVPWREQALGAGLGAAEANRRLDAIVALFTAAKRFAERRPDGTTLQFLAEILDAEVPEDLLLPRAVEQAVLVAPPSGVVSLEAEVVVVAGLQQGVWPNLRPRGTLFHPERIAAAASGSDPGERVWDERRAVLDDEIRMFALAVSRATDRVVLTAVANDDDQPSPLLRLGAPPEGEPVAAESAELPLSLRGATGVLRRVATSDRDPARRIDAAETLAYLAREGVPGADPASWLGVLPLSTGRPLYDGETIPVSPSRVTALEESALDWFLTELTDGDPGVAANVGTIVHWAMESVPDPRFETVWGAIRSRWDELVFEAPWLDSRQQRLTRQLAVGLSAYLTRFAESGAELVGAERTFRMPLGPTRNGTTRNGPTRNGTTRNGTEQRVEVRGAIDRVERAPDGSVVIVDLKTGTPITRAAEIDAHPQLGAYQLAYAEGLLDDALETAGSDAVHRAGGAKLLFVKSTRRNDPYLEASQDAFDETRLGEVRERLERAATLIAAAEFEGLLEVEDRGPIDRSSFRLQRTLDVTSDGGA